ncbi:MAG: tetratricopeptide repeat protein [Flavobacteriaceae bacterium]|nr:tetratricopeptide repeat protein [Flavobacteriaceae bacterium]
MIFLGTSAYAQDQNTQDAYIQKKLNHIDSLLLEKEYEKAETVIKNTKNTFSFRNDIESKLALQYREAQILYNQGKQEDAVELFLIGLEKLRGHPTSYLNIEYASFLAKVFAGSQNFDKAIYYNKIALRKSLYLADTVNITKSYIRLGSFYYAKRKIDSAEYFFRRVTYFPVTPDTEQRISNAYNNLGVIAQNDDNFDLAKAWSKKALRIKQKQKDSLGMALLTVNIGNLDHYQFRYDRAINSYSEALRTIAGDSTKQAMHFKKGIYENLAVSYDSLGDYKMAFKNLSESVKIEEILTVDNLAENIAEVEAKYNLALEEQKTEEEKGKVFRAQVLFFGLAFLTLMFVVFSFIFYKNYKLKEQNKLEQINNDLQTRIINATIDAKEKERKSIAEILHDSVSALLSSANLHLQASKAQLKTEIPAEISKAQEIVNEASVKIRDLSHELISSVLLKFGLAFAVHDICEKYSNSELELVSDDNGIKRYNQKFEIKIYNIIEELINNILKHSKAKNASITLIERNDEKLLIQIIDDGQGFDVTKERKKDGLGLSHIEARVKIMEGVFNINSKKGEGTSIFISVPIYKLKIAQTA